MWFCVGVGGCILFLLLFGGVSFSFCSCRLIFWVLRGFNINLAYGINNKKEGGERDFNLKY